MKSLRDLSLPDSKALSVMLSSAVLVSDFVSGCQLDLRRVEGIAVLAATHRKGAPIKAFAGIEQ